MAADRRRPRWCSGFWEIQGDFVEEGRLREGLKERAWLQRGGAGERRLFSTDFFGSKGENTNSDSFVKSVCQRGNRTNVQGQGPVPPSPTLFFPLRVFSFPPLCALCPPLFLEQTQSTDSATGTARRALNSVCMASPHSAVEGHSSLLSCINEKWGTERLCCSAEDTRPVGGGAEV